MPERRCSPKVLREPTNAGPGLRFERRETGHFCSDTLFSHSIHVLRASGDNSVTVVYATR
jgi:hypothetical protein